MPILLDKLQILLDLGELLGVSNEKLVSAFRKEGVFLSENISEEIMHRIVTELHFVKIEADGEIDREVIEHELAVAVRKEDYLKAAYYKKLLG